MKKLISAMTVAAALMTAPAFAESRTYDLASFDEIEVSAGIEVTLTVDRTQSIMVEQPDGKFESIRLEVKDGVLSIKRVRTSNWGRRPKDFYVTIDVPSLTRIKATSGSEVGASGIDAENFELRVSSGASIDASGRCGTIEVHGSSGGSIDAQELECVSLDGGVSSGARIDAYASSSVDASASSGGSLRVFGGATDVDISKSSGGSVSVRN